MHPPDLLHFSHPLTNVSLLRAGSAPADWTSRLAAAERAAYDRGVIDGEKGLGEQLLRQRNELLQLHKAAVEGLHTAVSAVIASCEESLVMLAFETARKLVAQCPITIDTVSAAVRDAVSQLQAGEEFSVELHPDDLALLEQHTPPPGPAGDASVHRARFLPNTALTRGGCLVHTRFGIIDARHQIREARAAAALALT